MCQGRCEVCSWLGARFSQFFILSYPGLQKVQKWLCAPTLAYLRAVATTLSEGSQPF
jgi:hypothetical protein